MQYRNLGVIAMAGSAIAAYVPSEPWSTLTPSATLKDGTTEYTGSFGIAVNPIPTTSSLSAKLDAKELNRKAEATQIGDGQVQVTTATETTIISAVTQIGDGQIQAATETPKPKTVQPVTQIGDGQIQATTSTKTLVANVVTQIGDGQIQATTATITKQLVDNVITQIGDGQIQGTTASGITKETVLAVTQIGDGQIQATTAKETVQPVTQIGDGQIQATTAKETAQPVTQIGDGQIQATTATEKETAQPVTQIGDGQVQATTSTGTTETKTPVTQIGDGQVQATTETGTTETKTPATQIEDGQVQATSTGSAPAASDKASAGITLEACASNGTLSMELHDGILTDSKGRIGSIVANKQFQFDGPPPQAGAIYAAGWSISPEGKLAIGNSTTFYQCLSGNFYNLYSEHIGTVCDPVELDIVELVSC